MLTDKLRAFCLSFLYMTAGICYGFWAANSGNGTSGGLLSYLFYPVSEFINLGGFIGGEGAWILVWVCELIIFFLVLGIFLLLIKASRIAFKK